MRTIPDISELLIPLEQKISERFLPALLGRNITDNQREILELPVRYGGLGIINPARMSQREYECSRKITEPLVKLICEQNSGLESLDQGSITGVVHHLKKEQEELLKQRYKPIYERCGLSLQRHLEQAKEPGASSWLTALPLKSLNYILSKREFQDSVCLRYGWTIKDMPTYCGCGERNSVNHSLDCKVGGYVNMRHNAIRDSLSYLLKEAKCKDVRTEPSLLPVQATRFSRSTSVQDEVRLDISAVGVYAPFERTFFDVQVTHSNCESNSYKHLDTIYQENEREKKNKYEERVLQSEKGTFVPLIFTTSGRAGPLCSAFMQRLANLISTNQDEAQSHVINHIRTQLRFALLKCTLIALRGVRGTSKAHYTGVNEIAFNLIPNNNNIEVS
eukprot:gene21051-23106_t